ncbi:Bacteriophage protein [Mycobacteroides abscessus subsp. abscessus]|nr:Bacteriophage protein [Mycobacteroides abscessus subsp. abscessus]
MSLADDLSKQPTAQEVEYRPRTEFDGQQGYVQTGALAEPPASYTELLRQFGYNPDEVQIVGHPRVSRWQGFNGEWLAAYRFHIAPKTAPSNLDELINRVNEHQPHNPVGGGPHFFVYQAGDLQLGKRSRDGSTEQIVARYLDSVDAAVTEFGHLTRHGIEGVQISMPGDCIEGSVSQNSKNLWLTQETVTEQVRILRRLMLHTVEQFAPLTNKVYLDVVNGNHDEHSRAQNFYPGDGWATEAAIAVSDALEMNPAAFGHVEVRVPNKWNGSMTVPVGSTTVTVVHGHQWRIGQGFKWWQEQCFGNQNPAGAQVLQHGHQHSWEVQTSAQRIRISSSTFDCGSDWYRDAHGQDAKRGGLTYLLRDGEVSRMSLV